MTIAEFEALAIGMDTGYTDRYGTPIKVGDEVVYYKKCTKQSGLDFDELQATVPHEFIVGSGACGYIYTGKVIRYRYVVGFTFEKGLSIIEDHYKYLEETDDNGNLITVVVDNERKSPKLSFEDLICDYKFADAD